MRFLKLTAFVLTGILLLLFGCKKDEETTDSTPPTPPTQATQPYYALDEGNYWIYNVSRWDSSGVFLGDVRTDSFYVDGKDTINGTVYTIVQGASIGGGPWATLYRLENDKLYHKDGSLVVDESIIGDTIWQDTVPPFYSIAVVVEEEPAVAVPAGIFDCLSRVGYISMVFSDSTRNFQDTIRSQYAPGLGLVADESAYSGSRISIKRELIRYHINN